MTDSSQEESPASQQNVEDTSSENHDNFYLENRYLNISNMPELNSTESWWETVDDASLFQRGNRPMYSAHWSVAWSDLMMTMFILFLVMYVYKTSGHDFLSRSNSGKPTIIQNLNSPMVPGGMANGQGGRSQEEISQSFSRLYDFSQLVINQNSLKNFAAINLTPDKTIRIILTSDLLFEPGQAYLQPSYQASLQKIATIISDTPYKINIVGHTDSLPINSDKFPSNWELSAARAGAVARFLIAATNLPPNHFEIIGRANFQPIANNDTEANRAKNRRVEIIITREKTPAKQFNGDLTNLKP